MGGEPSSALLSEGFLSYDFDLSPLSRFYRGDEPSLLNAAGSPRSAAPRAKRYDRALVELLMMVVPVGTSWYWYKRESNAVDWELRWDQDSWRRKLITMDAVRFDANDFRTNAFLHPFATGMWYHVAGRTNDLGALESLFLSTLASGSWEYIIEFRELVSLNDMIATPVAGLPFGEVFYQYGEFFSRGSDRSVNALLSTLPGAPQRLHAWMDGEQLPEAREVDRFGFPTDVAHAFELSMGLGFSSTRGAPGEAADRAELGVRTEIITWEGYGRPGHVPWSPAAGTSTKLVARVVLGDRGSMLASAYAEASLVGLYAKAIERVGEGEGDRALHGTYVFAGLGTAYELTLRDIGAFRDKLGIVSVLGPVLDFTAYMGRLKIRATLDVYGDFAMITPYASRSFFEGLGGRATKAVLKHGGYYFGGGVTVLPEVALRYRWIDTGVEARLDYIGSIEGLDRREESIVEQARAVDRRVTYRVWLGAAFPEAAMKLAISREEALRDGWISVHYDRNVEALYLARVSFIF